MHPIVYDVTKVWIQVIYLTVLLVMNYATLLDDPDETESLAVPFETTKHGATVDMKTRNIGGDEGLYIDAEHLFFGGIMISSTII